jgi:hypothetical protein
MTEGVSAKAVQEKIVRQLAASSFGEGSDRVELTWAEARALLQDLSSERSARIRAEEERDEAKAYTEKLDKSWFEIAETRLDERARERIRAEAAEASNALLVRRVEELTAMVTELADDLESEIVARSPNELPRRIERDLEPVRRARALLKTGEG